ncbi:MAG: hypothetical protein U0S50_08660 [Sphingopyxis sp.]|uniref:hypothetical protein n=1 Tax=Sphingopyxis sp. TaxID=1908224 RepID=UPI002AB8F151|nr:hypothetical protein [Sphingopyxis sp.]MDZ3831873.1 hypothetical protein [Sphingopyxis sp.]
MTFLWIAAALGLTTFVVHTFVGSRYAVPALIAAEATLPKATIWLNYLCWHIVSGLLLILALALATVATGRIHIDAAIPIAAVFCWISVWSVLTTFKAHIPAYRFPASWLGGATALFILLGLVR